MSFRTDCKMSIQSQTENGLHKCWSIYIQWISVMPTTCFFCSHASLGPFRPKSIKHLLLMMWRFFVFFFSLRPSESAVIWTEVRWCEDARSRPTLNGDAIFRTTVTSFIHENHHHFTNAKQETEMKFSIFFRLDSLGRHILCAIISLAAFLDA